jgi:hypothetical protein
MPPSATVTDYVTLEALPGGSRVVPLGPDSMSSYLNNVFTYALIIVSTVAVFALMYYGITYLTTDIVNKKAEGKDGLIKVLSGLLFIFTAWLVLNSINPDLLRNAVNFGIGSTSTLSGGAVVQGGGQTSSVQGQTTGVVPLPSSPPRCATIPQSELTMVQGYPLRTSAANNFNLMYQAAQRDGITLVVTSGYRTDARQLELYNQMGCSNSTGRVVCSGGQVVALPCSLGGQGSNHSTGYALDISVGCSNGTTCNSAIWNWLKRNGGQYGFNNNLPNDPVHWSPSGR